MQVDAGLCSIYAGLCRIMQDYAGLASNYSQVALDAAYLLMFVSDYLHL